MADNNQFILDQLEKDIKDVLKDVKKIKQDVVNEVALQVYEDMDELFVKCIDKFYANYEPKFYRREGSLYHVYNLTVKNGIITRNFGSQYMPVAYKHNHRVSNQYIYDQMFLQGYHGGSHTIDEEKVDLWGEHPDDGTPWYRTPPLTKSKITPYTKWSSRPAAQSKAPAQDIVEQIENYEKGKTTIINRNVADAINAAWDLVLGRYNLFNNY